jgi:hypothetical protein
MIIYQVVDEKNNCVSEYSHLDAAIHTAEDFTVWCADHYYHVEEFSFHEPEDFYKLAI